MELICTSELFEKLFSVFFFQSFRTKFLSLLYMISLAYKISHCLSANHYPGLRCVICTGVTLFALVLHLNCTALSRSESSNFFMCTIIIIITSGTGKTILQLNISFGIFRHSRYWTGTSLQWRLMRGDIITKRSMSLAFEKTPRISLTCKLVPVQYLLIMFLHALHDQVHYFNCVVKVSYLLMALITVVHVGHSRACTVMRWLLIKGSLSSSWMNSPTKFTFAPVAKRVFERNYWYENICHLSRLAQALVLQIETQTVEVKVYICAKWPISPALIKNNLTKNNLPSSRGLFTMSCSRT